MMGDIMAEPDLELYQASTMASITVQTLTNRNALEVSLTRL
jgi:hypothetical protein